jgi:hypothetical protein
VRRQYYDDAPWSHWIVEMELDPLQLIVVDDDSGKRYRVPVSVTGEDAFTFGPAVEVAVRYVDKTTEVAASASTRMVFASRAESRPGDRPAATAVEPNPAVEPVEAPPVVADPTTAPVVEPTVPPAAEPDPTTEKEERVSADIRSLLGVPDDADDAAIAAAIEELKTKATPVTDETTETVEVVEKADVRAPELVGASAGAKNVDALAEMRAEIERLSGEVAASKADKAAQVKASVFRDAVQLGKITPGDRKSWEARYDKAPDVITDVLASIAAGTAVPVSPSGVVGDDLDTSAVAADVPDDIAGLFSTPFGSKEN